MGDLVLSHFSESLYFSTRCNKQTVHLSYTQLEILSDFSYHLQSTSTVQVTIDVQNLYDEFWMDQVAYLIACLTADLIKSLC